MQDAIQKVLDELTAQNDNRIDVFDLQIEKMDNAIISLRGKLLDEGKCAALRETYSHLFPDLGLDIASIRILNRESHERVHVATNLTGLYEKPTFGMPLSSELYYRTELEILDEEGSWVFTRQTDGYLGWAYRSYLAEGDAGQATHLILAPSYELREEPNAASSVITRVVSGTGIALEETRGEWGKVSANKTGWMPLALLRATDELPKSMEERRQTLIEDSARMIGVPYLWGGTSGNGIDCSGFARLLHRWIGIEIPRDADIQHTTAKPIEPPFEAGDLLFFGEGGSKRHITHVGLSLGGWKMIHSSRGRNGVYIDDVQERDALKQIFVSAGSFLR
jgi:hypothetical protein